MNAPTRPYHSPKREAQAAATRQAILEAFIDQLKEGGRTELSPADAARRAGVSLRTVQTYFPTRAARIAALADWIDRYTYPDGVEPARGPEDLARYFLEVHTLALASPLTRVFLAHRGDGEWEAIRAQRRAERLEAIRSAVEQIGAPSPETEDAVAMLLGLSGADASLPLHDVHGLPLERVPSVLAHTVELIVADLRRHAARRPTSESDR